MPPRHPSPPALTEAEARAIVADPALAEGQHPVLRQAAWWTLLDARAARRTASPAAFDPTAGDAA